MRKTAPAAPLIFMLVILSSCGYNPDYSPNQKYHSTRFPQTRTISEAKVWLHWSVAERIAFVRSLVIGYREGTHDVCNAATGVSDSRSTCRQRTEHLPSSVSWLGTDQKVNGYSKAMTEFYEGHSEDDDVPITVLFGWLAFEQKTPTAIHNLLTPRTLK